MGAVNVIRETFYFLKTKQPINFWVAKMGQKFVTSNFQKTEKNSQAKIGYLYRTRKYSDLKNLQALGEKRKQNSGDNHLNTESYHFHKLFMTKSDA